jgi:transcriptional regulator with XRE-family HTH domain
MVTPPTPANIADLMAFSERLAATRHERGLTQQILADRVGVHVTQIRRYEAGTSAPTLDVLRNLAVALAVTTDSLVFDEHERDPAEELRLQFEATTHLDDEGKALVKALIEGVLLRQESRRWANAS